jgi:hypothetical protein
MKAEVKPMISFFVEKVFKDAERQPYTLSDGILITAVVYHKAAVKGKKGPARTFLLKVYNALASVVLDTCIKHVNITKKQLLEEITKATIQYLEKDAKKLYALIEQNPHLKNACQLAKLEIKNIGKPTFSIAKNT